MENIHHSLPAIFTKCKILEIVNGSFWKKCPVFLSRRTSCHPIVIDFSDEFNQITTFGGSYFSAIATRDSWCTRSEYKCPSITLLLAWYVIWVWADCTNLRRLCAVSYVNRECPPRPQLQHSEIYGTVISQSWQMMLAKGALCEI
jgi:hypothetical protein